MKISGFYFSLFLILVSGSNVLGQDTIVRQHGLRLGVDLSRFLLPIIEPGHTAYEVSADIEAFKNFYPVIHFGQENFTTNKNDYDYTSNGTYWRVGFEYNALKKIKYDQYEMVFAGLNYGFTNMDQQADNIYLYDPYWGGYYASMPASNYKGQWIELTGGIRAELFKNFFIGWSVSGRILLSHSQTAEYKPYYLSGFGDLNKKTNLGFTYSIFYRLPFYKTTHSTNIPPKNK